MITALVVASVLLGAPQSEGIEWMDCHEATSCHALKRKRVASGRQHRALFAEGVTSYIEADLKLPADDRRLPDPPSPGDPVYVVTSPHIPLVQRPQVRVLPSIATAEELAKRKGRRLAVAEFKLSEASSGPDGGPAVDVIVSAGTIVPQPRPASRGPQWKYVSRGFDAYHVYRRPNGQLVFRLEARAAD